MSDEPSAGKTAIQVICTLVLLLGLGITAVGITWCISGAKLGPCVGIAAVLIGALFIALGAIGLK